MQAKAFKADQAKTAEVDQLVKDVAKHFGHLDILVNNAAVAVTGAIDDAEQRRRPRSSVRTRSTSTAW